MPSRQRINVWLICLTACMCMGLNGYDAASFNTVYGFATFIKKFAKPGQTKIDPNILGAINTAYTCGGIVPGYLVTPTLSKLAGRKLCMQIGCLFVIAASFLQAFAPNLNAFIAGRLLVGVGQGLVLPSGPTYVSEIAPASIRGQVMSCWQVWYTIGAFLVYWIGYGVNHAPHLGDWQWRIPQLLQIFLPTLIFTGLFFCPESPRWLAEKGRVEQARAALRIVRSPEEADEEIEAIVDALAYEKAYINKGEKWWTPYKTIWTDTSIRRRFLLALFINGGQQICGNGQLGSYSTLIYQQVFADADTIFLINALAGTFNIFFTLNATWFVEKIGRRKMFIIGAIGMAVSLLCVASVGVGVKAGPDGKKPYGLGIGIATLFFLFSVAYKPTWGATVWIYTSEIFSTNVRAHCISMTTQFQGVVNAIVNQFFPLFLAKCGFYTFFFFMGVNVILALGVYFFLPETKGVPLEEMDAIFGATSHRKAGHEMVVGGEAAPDQISSTPSEEKEYKIAHVDSAEKSKSSHVLA